GLGLSGDTVQVDLGNGDGAFRPPIITGPLNHVNQGPSAGIFDFGFAVADLNGDGKLDVVLAETDGSVGVLRGKGDGTFEPLVTSGGERDPDHSSLGFAAG